MIRQVEYFEKPGKENTPRCLEIVSGLVDEGFLISSWLRLLAKPGCCSPRNLRARP